MGPAWNYCLGIVLFVFVTIGEVKVVKERRLKWSTRKILINTHKELSSNSKMVNRDRLNISRYCIGLIEVPWLLWIRCHSWLWRCEEKCMKCIMSSKHMCRAFGKSLYICKLLEALFSSMWFKSHEKGHLIHGQITKRNEDWIYMKKEYFFSRCRFCRRHDSDWSC